MALGLAASVLGMPSTEQGSSPSFVNVTATGKFLAADGATATPSYTFTAETGTGMYRANAGVLGFSAQGVGLFNFYRPGGNASAINGNVVANSILFFDTGAVNVTAAGVNQNVTLTPSGTGQVVASGGLQAVGQAGAFNASDGVLVDVQGSSNHGRIQAFTGGGATPRHLELQAILGGNVLIGTTVDSSATLQIGTNTTTTAGGAVFGTDLFFYRSTTGQACIDPGSGTNNASLKLNARNAGVSVAGTISVTGSGNTIITTGSGGGIILQTNGSTSALTIDSSQLVQFNAAASFSANAAIATTMTSVGPTGSHTTVQEWLTIKNASGTTRYIPCY